MSVPPSSYNAFRSRNRLLTAILLLAIGAWLLINLPRNSLWYDEALTTYVATHSWQDLWRWCTQVDIQVPLHYIVLRLWAALIGDSEFSLRLLSAFCALLAAAAMVAIGRKLSRRYALGSFAGYAAAILLIALPGMLWLGYEVRAYALGLALYAWATAFLCELLSQPSTPQPLSPMTNHPRFSTGSPSPYTERGPGGEVYPSGIPRPWLILAYALLMIAALYTHYTAIGGFAAHFAILAVAALVQRSRFLFKTLIAITLLVGIGFAPWLPILLTRSAADRSYYVGTPIPPDRAVSVMIGFKLLGREDSPPVALPLVAGYLGLMLLGALVAFQDRRWKAALAGLMIAIWPVAITAGLVYFKPKLAGRYAWPAWIGFDLLVALFVARVAQVGRWWRPLAVVPLAVIIAILWTTGATGHPPESDFRAAYAYLCTHGDPADTVILHDGTLFVVDAYYGQRSPCDAPRQTISLPAAEITNIDTALTLKDAQSAMQAITANRPPSVWIVSWQSDVMDPQNLVWGLLDGTGTHSVTARMFGDVRLDRYEQPRPRIGDPLAVGQTQNRQPVPDGPTLRSLRIFAPEVAHDGDVIVVQAWWTLGKALQGDLRVSARLSPPEGGKPYVQVDQPPSAYKYMDDRWQQGVPALGRYELTVTQQVPAGPVAVDYVIYDVYSRWQPIILHVGQITVSR